MNEWDFTRIYKDLNAFEEDAKKLSEDIDGYNKFKGKINDEKSLIDFLNYDEKVVGNFSKIYTYASMFYDQQQKEPSRQKVYATANDLYAKYVQVTSFASSEILALGEENVKRFVKENKELTKYAYPLDKIFHNQSHIFEPKIEEIMANYVQVTNNYNRLYDMLAVADGKSSSIKLSTGEEIEVNQSNFRQYLATLKNQDDRRIVFEAVFKGFEAHKNTFAGIYNGIIQSDYAEAKNRKYNSILESFLYGNNIPTDVYLSLIKTVRENTDVLKEYYALRKQYFCLKELHTYDRFLDFASTDKKYTYEEAKELFFESVAKIGGEFEKVAHEVLAEGRVDVYPHEGKRTGAYSTGYYKEGPFILLNHTGMLDDCFTCAHEAGHSIHTTLANANQPVATADYTIFVAEIASTFNEQLLLDHLLSKTTDKETRLVLLQSAIDGLIATFYRQTLFADYEYQAHKLVEEGKPVTVDVLSSIMKDLYLEYYGIDLNNEPYKEYVWAYIPHFFHSPFYVYQYATCYASSLQIYDMVKNNVPGALDNYLNMLKAGGSDYPVEIVKKGGVDLTTPEPFMAVCKRLKELLEVLKNELK